MKAEFVRAASSRAIDPATFGLFAGIIFANVIAWAWAFMLFADRPAVMATALLAWVFGLRHAVDADHIAAIDNAVRKMMHEGAAPRSAGLYFALGHSTVVMVATLVLSATAMRLAGDSMVKTVGSVIGASVSAAFLLVIALLNLAIFMSLWRTFRAVRNHEVHQLEDLDTVLAGGGLLARMLGPMFRMVTKSWHLYPLGFLFGLGFDTATSIGLLSISAAEAVRGVSLWSVLVFPALFACGMALVDTADSVLMVNAYRWAFVDPLRKLWYNLTITGASVVVALFIGGVEALDLLADRLGLSGGLWSAVAGLNDSLANFGFAVIGVFAAAWLMSVAVYRAAFADRRAGVPDGCGADVIECVDAAEVA
ncbi:MAG: HoxN/HupN/NixA family nickel/cobalt transporter [Bradyrhizobium sp.]|uniref:HoxN/HupN/NixA family nickel/cobalt transporter n=1 Tax=Bradyrhizobium sp. TaxID=376 RepID=UPI0025C5E3A4|nr:HoxN/HupN/NixA family nickel/cobalt transporter [Bradyrhizobium sp.]MBI5260631.1 HoxN/HupN/NixA family nickel/cobalt transporter [Bradyrhizobium sp.]